MVNREKNIAYLKNNKKKARVGGVGVLSSLLLIPFATLVLHAVKVEAVPSNGGGPWLGLWPGGEGVGGVGGHNSVHKAQRSLIRAGSWAVSRVFHS